MVYHVQESGRLIQKEHGVARVNQMNVQMLQVLFQWRHKGANRSQSSFFCLFPGFEATKDTLTKCREGYTPDECFKCQRCFKSWWGQLTHMLNFVVAQTVSNEWMISRPKGSTCDQCSGCCAKSATWDQKTGTFFTLFTRSHISR